jgi:hypothetical protein
VITPDPFVPRFNLDFGPFRAMTSFFTEAVLIASLAMLLMLFLAPHAERVAQALIAQPLVSGGVGLLTVVVAPIVFVALGLLTILLVTAVVTVPLMVILALAIGTAFLFGWVAIGYEIGRRFTKAVNWNWHPAFSAGLGTFALTLVANAGSSLNFLPGLQCVTFILPSLVGLFALGAVVLTRFGTQAVAPSAAQTAVVPVQPSRKKPG